MQVGDAFGRVHHCKFTLCRVHSLNVCFNFRPFRFRQALDSGIHISQTIIEIHSQLFHDNSMLFKDIFIED